MKKKLALFLAVISVLTVFFCVPFSANAAVNKYVTGALNMREKPSSSAKKILTVPQGSTVSYLEKDSGEYSYITYKSKKGWVLSAYLTANKYTPAQIASVKKSLSGTKVKLTWTAVNNAKGYNIYLYNASTKKYSKMGTRTTTDATISNLKKGTTYYFAVAAYNVVNGKTYTGKKSPKVKVDVAAATKDTIKQAYAKIIKKYPNDSYAINDIDKDGVKELIIDIWSVPEVERKHVVYTYKSGAAKKLGSIAAGHSYLVQDSKGTLYKVCQHQGDLNYQTIVIKNGKPAVGKVVKEAYYYDDEKAYTKLENYIDKNFTSAECDCKSTKLLDKHFKK